MEENGEYLDSSVLYPKIIQSPSTMQSLLSMYSARHTNTQTEILIRKTCPCNEYPLIPHFYIEKLGYARVYLFFLFLSKNKKNIKIFPTKFSIYN